jgi:bisphosphoglycerate-independent phosphoglycerate mutase (AlkP superfamily)
MIHVDSTTYYEALDVLQGKNELPSIFAELETFIEDNHSVVVANFASEKMKQNSIAMKFAELNKKYLFCAPEKLNWLFVCFSDFRAEIRSEVNFRHLMKQFHFLRKNMDACRYGN